jgi:hypothetical protein
LLDIRSNKISDTGEHHAGNCREGGRQAKPGQVVVNRNGTLDVGSMQFNTGYLRDLARYGISPADVASSGCYSFNLAAWRLRQHIRHDKGDLWTKSANYHSRTPEVNARYRSELITRSGKWAKWLEVRFPSIIVETTHPIHGSE